MRRAGRWLLAVIAGLGVAWLWAPGWHSSPPVVVVTPSPSPEVVDVAPLGALAPAVAWPPSAGLVVSEVVTGGASASDEFVELYNASTSPLDLAGLELVYVTSSGSTVTRKQTWTSLVLPPHRHLLVANSGGIYVAAADGLYAGGFAATGGSIALRTLGGTVIDSLSWGDAASQFVEGTPGPAPAAGSSLERLPGGAAGNATDTNDNLADTRVAATPSPQSLATAEAPPPSPTPLPTPSPTATPTPTTAPMPTSTPTNQPTDTATSAPTSTPVPTMTASATVSPSPSPSATPSASPTPSPTSSPSPSPSPPPTPTPNLTVTPSTAPTSPPTESPQPSATGLAIAAARSLAVGSQVLIIGAVTAEVGTVLGETTFAIEDATGGILVKLPSGTSLALALGHQVVVSGALAAPYGNLEVRPAADGVTVAAAGTAPEPRDLAAADLGETTEGLIARLTGELIDIESGSSGSLTLFVADDSGEGRVFFDARFGLPASDFETGQTLAITGIVGDRLGLYRLWPRTLADVAVIASPPSPTRTPTPSPTRTPTPVPQPTPSPAPPAVMSIADALPKQGQDVAVEGVVTTRAGLLDADGQRVVMQDATAAVVVRLPAEADAHLGDRLRVHGEMTTYYGAPSLSASEARVVGDGRVTAQAVARGPLTADLEWQLVTLSGRVDSVHKDGDAWRAELTVSGTGIPVSGLARSGIPPDVLVAGRTATITGIVRRAYPTASDQRFALVPRSRADIRLGAAPRPTDRPSSGGGGHGSNPTERPRSVPPASSASVTPGVGGSQALADLAGHESEVVSVGGLITAIAGTRLTIADDSATAVIRLAGDAAPLARTVGRGDLVNATGTVQRSAHLGLEVVVDDPAGLRRLSQALTTASPTVAPAHHDLPGYQVAPPQPRPGTPAFAVLALLGAAALMAMIGLLAAQPRVRGALKQRMVTLKRG